VKKEHVTRLRGAIVRQLELGRGARDIAATLGGSRRVVYKVASQLRTIGLAAAHDLRINNPGRPPLHAEEIAEIVARARGETPGLGPRVMHALMQRHPGRFGLTAETVPSAAYLERAIRRLGLATRPVGPRDQRILPDARPTEPGTITVDGWGPWQVGATKLDLATAQDRWTRLALAVPSDRQVYPDTAGGYVGFDTRTWALALWAAATHLCGRSLRRVYADNGVGLIPAFLTLPQATRLALALGATVVFIPPAQPWRDGRLERFHWSMEREFWRQERPARMEEALAGLVAWRNYYNRERPHAVFDYRSPHEEFGHAPLLEPGYWRTLVVPAQPRPVPGQVECLRMVANDGAVNLWGHALPTSPDLGGQYVRVVFNVTGAHADGRVVWQGVKGTDLVVAQFAHRLDVPGEGSQGEPLVLPGSVRPFPLPQLPRNERLHEEQWSNQQSRVARRPMGRDRSV
jgi:transposase InsO family protein